MTVHVLRRGVRHDVRPEFERTAQDRRRERVVNNQRHARGMRDLRELLDVENTTGRIRHRLAEDTLGVRTNRRGDRLSVRIRIDERRLNAKLLERDRQEIERATVDLGTGHHVIPSLGDVHHRKHARRLTGARQNRRHAAFKRGDLARHRVVRRVRETRVEVTGRLEVEQVRHLLGRLIAERRGLHNRRLTGLAALRLPSTLNTQSINRHLLLLHSQDLFKRMLSYYIIS